MLPYAARMLSLLRLCLFRLCKGAIKVLHSRAINREYADVCYNRLSALMLTYANVCYSRL